MGTKPINREAAIRARKFLRQLKKELEPKIKNPKGNDLDTDIQIKRLEYLKIVNFDIDEGFAEFRDYISPKIMAKKLADHEKKHANKNLASLRSELARVEVDLEMERSYATINKKMIDYMKNYIEGVEYARGANSRKRQAGALSNRQEDNRRRTECLSKVLEGITNITGFEYHKYFSLLNRTYPKPLYVPRPRLTAAEKKLSKQKQKEILEEKEKDRDGNWLDQTERAFFKRAAGVAAKTKKASPLKS